MNKILVIRFSSIGDIVLTSPIVRCLKLQLKGDTEIHFITKRKYASLVKSNPYIDKVHLINTHINELFNVLAAENFSCIIDLHNNFRSILLRGKLGALAYTITKNNIEKWLLVNFKINKMPKKHIVERYFEAVNSLGVIYDGKGLDYFIPKNEQVDFELIPLSHHKNYIAIAIGGTYFTKRLPVEKLIAICKKLKKPIFLLGGKEDEVIALQIKQAVGENVYNSCGLFSVNQSASIIERASKVITHDTGMMHIAAAFKKDVISIWGNTVPDFGMYPFLPSSIPPATLIEVKGLNCRPCSKLGYTTCPKKHFKCMNEIDENEIVRLAKN